MTRENINYFLYSCTYHATHCYYLFIITLRLVAGQINHNKPQEGLKITLINWSSGECWTCTESWFYFFVFGLVTEQHSHSNCKSLITTVLNINFLKVFVMLQTNSLRLILPYFQKWCRHWLPVACYQKWIQTVFTNRKTF